MSDWKLIPNPEWKDQSPRPLGPATCHDGSPFITVECTCGEHMHMHETQTAAVPDNLGVASRCHGCGEILQFQPGFFTGSFAEFRRQGWTI